MTSALNIHEATGDEVAAAHRNVFDIWSKGRPLDEHVAYRLASPSHRQATWYVGCLDGRVVVSLGSYPLRFRLRGESLSGIAIGSVYTLGEFRGRGFAGELLAWVGNQAQHAGAALSVLFSDIDPGYYARRGYALCPSWCGWSDPCEAPAAAARPTHRLVPISAQEDLPAIRRLYADYHGWAPLSVERTDEYWAMILQKFPGDEFFALEDVHGAWAGYARLGRKDDHWRITDFALADQSAALAEHFYAAVLALGATGGARRVGGWLPDSEAARKFFELEPRGVEITMIKPLAWSGKLDKEVLSSTSRFCEIDHV
jgi:predicted N-acetyltransferase YhbS